MADHEHIVSMYTPPVFCCPSSALGWQAGWAPEGCCEQQSLCLHCGTASQTGHQSGRAWLAQLSSDVAWPSASPLLLFHLPCQSLAQHCKTHQCTCCCLSSHTGGSQACYGVAHVCMHNLNIHLHVCTSAHSSQLKNSSNSIHSHALQYLLTCTGVQKAIIFDAKLFHTGTKLVWVLSDFTGQRVGRSSY